MFSETGSVEIVLLSLLVSVFLVLASRLFPGLVLRRSDLDAVQSAHERPTPRLGGIALLAGYVAGYFVLPESVQPSFAILLVSAIPVFAFGLVEDFQGSVSTKARLLAAMGSSIVAIALFQLWIPRVDVPFVDEVLTFILLGGAFTVFATTGVCNAFNLIDGLHGLCSAAGFSAAVGLAVIGAQAGVPEVTMAASVIAAALVGFAMVNYPLGLLFMGDAGAYSLGHLLAWLAVMLLALTDTVSAWALVLVFFWPLADTFFAIYRRLRAGRPTDQPDRLHYHQLVMRALEIGVFGRGRRHVTNPLTTALLLPVMVAPVLSGILLWNQPLYAFLTVILFSALFVLSYRIGVSLAAKRLLIRSIMSQTSRPGRLVPGE